MGLYLEYRRTLKIIVKATQSQATHLNRRFFKKIDKMVNKDTKRFSTSPDTESIQYHNQLPLISIKMGYKKMKDTSKH